jgi:hypothetical protein
MLFRYSTSERGQGEFDSLPRISLVLRNGDRAVEAVGLVDSGATVNVLPFDVGLRLGVAWNDAQARLPLTGGLGSHTAVPLFVMAEIKGLPPVKLAFAWVSRNDVPLILGQTNFFMEFDVSFYRSRLEFEVVPTQRV